MKKKDRIIVIVAAVVNVLAAAAIVSISAVSRLSPAYLAVGILCSLFSAVSFVYYVVIRLNNKKKRRPE